VVLQIGGLGVWPRLSQLNKNYHKYVYEYPARCNGITLVLLQDFYTSRVPAVPIVRSTILHLAVTGITYITLDGEMLDIRIHI
jgi:hypothetical protein